MAVSLSPSDFLGFQRPLTQHVNAPLIITNNNNKPIAFKIKTTAPKWYCVRPNSGRVEPGEHAEVTVMLQAFKEEPPLNAKCKHKFLIQSTVITLGKENLSPHEICASPEAKQEGKTYQQKIRVSYLPALTHTPEKVEDIPADTAVVMSRKPSLDDQPTLQPGSQPEPTNEPQQLEDPHHSAELSPPSHLDMMGTAQEVESGDAPHGCFPIPQDELSHLDATSHHVSPDAEQPAQPIPESLEREPEELPASVPAFTSTGVTASQENSGDACGYEQPEIESSIPTSTITTAAASPLTQNTTAPLIDATETAVQTTVHMAESPIPLRMVIAVLLLAVFFSVYIFKRT